MANLSHSLSDSWAGLLGPRVKARRPGPVTALEVESQLVRVAQIVPRGSGSVVSRVATAPLRVGPEADRSDPATIGAAVAAALTEMRLKTAQVVIGVPRQLVIVRTLTLPWTEDVRELASMVQIQVAKELPFRPEEAVIDFAIRRTPDHSPEVAAGRGEAGGKATATDSAPTVEVLTATMRRESIEFYQKLAAAAKLKLIALGWLSQAHARCLQACQETESTQPVALVSLKPGEVGVDIATGSSLLFSRGAMLKPDSEAPVPTAALKSDLAEPPPPVATAALPEESFIDAATIEVVRTLHSYGGIQPEGPVTRLMLAGATGQEGALLEALRQRLSIPCSLLDPGSSLNVPPTDRQAAAGAIGALGLGLGVNDPGGLPFDFLSPKRPAVQRNMRRIKTLAFTALATAVVITLLGFRAHLINKRLKAYGDLQAELAQGEKKLPIYRRMQRQAATIQNWSKQSHNWLEQYAYLSGILPGSEDLYITSFSVSGQGAIHLAAQARSGEILAAADRQLRAAGYEVKPLAINPGSEKHGYNFRSTVELLLPPKMKPDLTKAQPAARPFDDASLDVKGNSRLKGGQP